MILTTLCTYGIYTFVFVYPNDDHAFIPANSDEFVDGSDSPSRQFTEQDHAFDVVVFQEVHISPHLSDGCHRHHHDILTLWELVLIEPTWQRHLHRLFVFCGKRMFKLATQLWTSRLGYDRICHRHGQFFDIWVSVWRRVNNNTLV